MNESDAELDRRDQDNEENRSSDVTEGGLPNDFDQEIDGIRHELNL